LPIRVHYTGSWDTSDYIVQRDLHRAAPALVRAASTLSEIRPACGILAAGVQQRLVTAQHLEAAIGPAGRILHRSHLLAATHDIAQGAHALSEIDFARMCRRHGLPEPVRQAVRRDPSGLRRYLDAEWRRRDGRRVIAEVDGALHLIPRRWWDDQLWQNELVIAGGLVLRFPTVIVRCDERKVADQLRRAILI
jgi:hypothetical protein